MTRHELHKRLKSGTPLPFESIPVEFSSQKTLELWIKHNHGPLRSLPDELVNDNLRLVAVGRIYQRDMRVDRSWQAAQLILGQPQHAHLHHRVLMTLVENDKKYITRIDQAFVTREFMLEALSLNGERLLPYLDEQGEAKGLSFPLDKEVIDAAVSNSSRYFDVLPPEKFSDEAVKEILRSTCFSIYDCLTRIGKMHILIDLMRDEGHWPSGDPRPKYLWDTVEKLMKCKGDKSLYHLYLRTFPMEDVIAEMKTPARRRELLNVLTREEAIHYIKVDPALRKDHRFKGRLLEDDLGM